MDWRELLLATRLGLLPLFFSLYAVYLFTSENKGNSSLQLWNKADKSETKNTLFIGITSSPDHFLQRQSLRKTWLTQLPDSFRYKFLVGKTMCKEHPKDRHSVYDCEKWNLTLPKNVSENTLFYTNSLHPNEDEKDIETGMGFFFHIHHPIVIRFLGISKSSVTRGLARVVIMDLTTSSKISSVTFSTDSVFTHPENEGYIYKKLQNPVLLPRGFEGSLSVEPIVESSKQLHFEENVVWSHGNLLKILGIITKNPTKNMSVSYILSTFGFTVEDIDQLRSHEDEKHQRAAEWSLYSHAVDRQLQQEVLLYNDVLLLDMVDVYRNLPQKVLLFFTWVYRYHSVKYVLKTDDDTFIDIPIVKMELEKNSDWDWWSCFRIGWPVHRRGKWRETVYPRAVYPPFPSGAGYVLSHHVLAWLYTRIESLSTEYQGEDVALGIWLEAMSPSRHDGDECYWACSKQCHSRTCNAIQLSVEDIYNMWSNYTNCGNNICHCPDT